MHHGVILLSYGVSDRYRCTQGNADEQVDDESDDRTVCAHGCHRHRTQISGKVADNGNIRGVEQLS